MKKELRDLAKDIYKQSTDIILKSMRDDSYKRETFEDLFSKPEIDFARCLINLCLSYLKNEIHL